MRAIPLHRLEAAPATSFFLMKALIGQLHNTGVVFYDRASFVLHADGDALTTLGWSPTAGTLHDLLPEALFDLWRADLRQALRGGAHTHQLRHDGAAYTVSIAPARDELNVAAAGMLLVRAVPSILPQHSGDGHSSSTPPTPLPQHAPVSTTLGRLTHDINNPLTSILGFASILNEEVDEEQREFVQLILRSGERIKHTIESVLDLVQIREGKGTLSRTWVNVDNVVAEAVQQMQPQAVQKGLTLRHYSTAQAAVAFANDTAVHRVLLNLISNAIKYTDHGTVEVVVRQNAHSVYLMIRDTGEGIPEGFIPYLFDAFSQSTVHPKRAGHGLGLSIAKELVELMEGTITVKTTEGEGSTFAFSLPRRQTHHRLVSAEAV
ncbi:MAG: HAMP domain-containing sensor histidine kinase [Bacteroidota bacterium]